MWRRPGCRLHPPFVPSLVGLGVASGVIVAGLGLVVGPAMAAGSGPFQTVQMLAFATLSFWVWMLATGIILFRRRGIRRRIGFARNSCRGFRCVANTQFTYQTR
jgi:hypothetical protein